MTPNTVLSATPARSFADPPVDPVESSQERGAPLLVQTMTLRLQVLFQRQNVFARLGNRLHDPAVVIGQTATQLSHVVVLLSLTFRAFHGDSGDASIFRLTAESQNDSERGQQSCWRSLHWRWTSKGIAGDG